MQDAPIIDLRPITVPELRAAVAATLGEMLDDAEENLDPIQSHDVGFRDGIRAARDRISSLLGIES